MIADREDLGVLPREECLRLLVSRRLGHLAMSLDALPVVLPVRYAWLDGSVVFCTAADTALDDAATRDAVVAFEVDETDPVVGDGWSVLVTGRAQEIRDPDVLERARLLPLEPWPPAEPRRYVRVTTDLVSGRRTKFRTDAIAAATSGAP